MATRTISNSGGTRAWSDVLSWVEGAVPTAADDVVATATSGNLTIAAAAVCRSLNLTGYVATLTHNTATALTIGDATAGAGNVALKIAGTYTRASSTSSVSFISTSPTVQTVDFAGQNTGALTFNGAGGAWQITGGLVAAGAVTFTQGTLNTNNQNLTWFSFVSNGAIARTMTLGTSTITLTGTGTIWNAHSSITMSAASATFISSSTSATARTFTGGGHSYGTLSYTAATAAVLTLGGSTFGTLTVSGNAKTLNFTISTTTTVTNWNVNGTAGNLITIQSTAAGTPFTLSKASGIAACDYVSLKDSTAGGGALWFAGTHSTNVSGNTGWGFTDPQETPVPGGALASGPAPTASVSISPGGGAGAGYGAGAAVAVPPGSSIAGGYGPGEGQPTVVFRGGVREKPPLRLHREIITPSGRRYRWADDEPDPANVPSGGAHSSEMPGGFATSGCVLPRKPSIDYSDLERLSTLIVRGAGGEIANECRLERSPRTSGNEMAVSPDAVGWQANLEDDKSVRLLAVDQDQSHWREPSRQRQLQLSAVPSPIGSVGVTSDATNGLPALQLAMSGAWGAAAGFRADGWYDAGAGLRVARVYSEWETNFGTGAGDWFAQFYSTDVDDGSAFPESLADFLTGVASSGIVDYSPSTPRQYMMAHLGYAIAGGSDGTDFALFHKKLTVYGEPDLPVYGDDPGGVLASDVVALAVARFAPLLNIGPDSIEQSAFAIPHLVFLEPTTAAEVVKQASRFELPDWAVWEDREFVYHERGSRGKNWRARVAPAELEETGPQVDRLWESILVSYQDVDGTTKTVGPPGSGADTEDARLKDSDPDNPANQLGIIRRDLLAMGTSTVAGATEIGACFLEASRVLDTSGRAKFVGHVEDDRGVTHPYWRVRAGDSVTFVDSNDPSSRRIVKASHDDASRTCSVDLDSPPEGLAAVLEALGVVLIPLGLN